jgi:NhaA family Na+:H+ antiporter
MARIVLFIAALLAIIMVNVGWQHQAMLLMNLLGIRMASFYFNGGVLLWWFILQSGIHATTAGILAALMVPTRPYTNKVGFNIK